jgi:hypothetical protein
VNVIGKGLIERGSVMRPPITTGDIAAWICEELQSRFWTVTPSETGNALLFDVADPTGPNGQRSFVAEFTIREV